MAIFLPRRALELSSTERIFITPRVAALATLSEISIVILRPRTIPNGMTWDDSTKLAVSLRLKVDGVDYECRGGATGGVRGKGGQEGDYRLSWVPPWGFFGGDTSKRLGETAESFEAQLEITHVSGSPVDTEVEAWVEFASAPPETLHQSVAFDTASGANEDNGDGTLSVSHTALGTNRSAWVTGGQSDAGTSVTASYGGTGMTQVFFRSHGLFRHAGFRPASEPTTGAQTVEMVFSGGTVYTQTLGVVTMTGVHQTTSIGTPVTGASTSGNPTVTVGSVGSDDLVVDSVSSDYQAGTQTAGADQTGRVNELATTWVQRETVSTQAGSDGGVMSWAYAGSTYYWGVGWDSVGVAFKPAAVGYSLAGVSKDKTGAVLGSCECFLFKDNGDDTLTFVDHTTSDPSTGAYTFSDIVDNDAAYLVYFFKDDTPHVFDVTDHVLQPA